MGLTTAEKMILHAIPKGIENKTSIKNLCRKFRVSERDVKAAIEEFRKHHIPVGTLRSNGGGVFIATDQHQLNECIHNLQSQASKMNLNADNLINADFDWENNPKYQFNEKEKTA